MGTEMGPCFDFHDLRARVCPRHVPDGLSDELPGLYSSLFTTLEYFICYDEPTEMGACILDSPRHVLLFCRKGDTIEVLNKVFAINAADTNRACRALFRACPEARRIHIEVLFPPGELRLPKRVLYGADHMVIDLPATVQEYTASLGKSTRRTLRRTENRLRRDLPDIHTEIVEPGDRAQELFELFLGWKNDRFHQHGATSMWEDQPELVELFVKLLGLRGEAHITTAGHKPIAIAFVFPVGEAVFGRQAAFDTAFDDYRIGLASQYWVACDAVTRGAKRLYMGWGHGTHKAHLGGMPLRATRLSVFRSAGARVHSLDEAREVALRNLRRNGQRDYWRARHAARRAVDAAIAWKRRRSPDHPEAKQVPVMGRGEAASATSPAVPLADFGAVIYPAQVPDGLPEEMRSLYGSLFSTVDWFMTHDDPGPMGACVLDGPRHVILFHRNGDTLEILNKAFPLAAPDAQRACRALFVAFPDVRRIHLETMFPPAQLRLPRRVLYSTDHMVIDLPATVDLYNASLGKKTRNNAFNYQNRLRRDFPDMRTEIIAPGERSQELFDLFLGWKTDRFRSLGRSTYWDNDPALAPRFVQLLQRCGEAHVTTIGGEVAALRFVFPVGDSFCVQESAFDPRYSRYRLGFVSLYWVICNAIERQASSADLLWGTTDFKARFGATPRRATALSIFRDQGSRLWSADEAWEVASREAKRRAERDYWRARHAARHAVERVLKRPR